MSNDKVIGVVGLGAMGLGIAQVFAQAGFAVRATDANAGARETAHERLRTSLAPRIAAGKMTVEGQAAALGALQIVETPAKIGAAHIIVEAILEDMGAKKALWAELEPMAGPTCIFASVSARACTSWRLALRRTRPRVRCGEKGRDSRSKPTLATASVAAW